MTDLLVQDESPDESPDQLAAHIQEAAETVHCFAASSRDLLKLKQLELLLRVAVERIAEPSTFVDAPKGHKKDTPPTVRTPHDLDSAISNQHHQGGQRPRSEYPWHQ